MGRPAALYRSAFLLVLLIGLPCAVPLLPLRDPNALGDPLVERFLPPCSRVWCAETPAGDRVCATSGGALAAARPVRHWLGTDLFGRDLLSRLLAGARVSLRAALTALILMLVAGSAAGLGAALAPRADAIVSFLSDLLLSVPRLFLLLLASAFYRPGPLVIATLIAATSWMGVARLVRAEARVVLGRDFVRAARAAGAARLRLALAHVLPHLQATLVVAAILRVPDLLLLDAALGYLGLAAPPPAATLGGLMNGSAGSLRDAWWLGAFPGLWVVGLALGFATLAEALRGRSEPAAEALL